MHMRKGGRAAVSAALPPLESRADGFASPPFDGFAFVKRALVGGRLFATRNYLASNSIVYYERARYSV